MEDDAVSECVGLLTDRGTSLSKRRACEREEVGEQCAWGWKDPRIIRQRDKKVGARAKPRANEALARSVIPQWRVPPVLCLDRSWAGLTQERGDGQ